MCRAGLVTPEKNHIFAPEKMEGFFLPPRDLGDFGWKNPSCLRSMFFGGVYDIGVRLKHIGNRKHEGWIGVTLEFWDKTQVVSFHETKGDT